MKPLVLLILAVVWGVALIPPLLRSRSDLRPNSSVMSFRRTLADLSRIPGRAPYYGRPVAPMRAFQAPSSQAHGTPMQTYQGAVPRRVSPMYGYAPGLARARANRAAMIRRRQNVLLTLLTAVLLSGVVGFALDAPLGRVAFFVCLLFLALYVWMLATLRRNEELRSAQRYVYSDAA
jgi:hypothetical protein